ncbi:MAG: EF-hand domain-containing protein [Hyphomicrobium sp.]|nr:EF-hand domain-containing protein [Hyphomicrobium sp.]
MISRSLLLGTAAYLGVALALSLPAEAGHRDCSALHALNPDGDGSLDWREVRSAAKALFHKLNNDGDGTLELDEVAGRVGLLSFARANPDRDGSLDMGEWLGLVKHRFERANPDGDATIECDEWTSLRGLRLQKVTY